MTNTFKKLAAFSILLSFVTFAYSQHKTIYDVLSISNSGCNIEPNSDGEVLMDMAEDMADYKREKEIYPDLDSLMSAAKADFKQKNKNANTTKTFTPIKASTRITT